MDNKRRTVLTERNYGLMDHGDGYATVMRYDPFSGQQEPILDRQWLPDALFDLEMLKNGMMVPYPRRR